MNYFTLWIHNIFLTITKRSLIRASRKSLRAKEKYCIATTTTSKPSTRKVRRSFVVTFVRDITTDSFRYSDIWRCTGVTSRISATSAKQSFRYPSTSADIERKFILSVSSIWLFYLTSYCRCQFFWCFYNRIGICFWVLWYKRNIKFTTYVA